MFRAIYTEMNAKLQAEALRLGPITYLSKEEAQATSVSVGSQLMRAWDFWRLRAQGGLR